MAKKTLPTLTAGTALALTDITLTRIGANTSDTKSTFQDVFTLIDATAQTTKVGILSTVNGINAKTVANTLLYTVPVGRTAVITGAVIRCSAASAITVGPSVGIGYPAGTSNIFAANATAITTTTAIFGLSLVGASVSAVAGSAINLNLTVAATGTSQTLSVDLIGYLI